MPLTTQGKEAAITGFRERQARGKTEKKINNSALYAGSPMHFDCTACGCQNITVPESWISKPDLCVECQALKTIGWLDEAMVPPEPNTDDTDTHEVGWYWVRLSPSDPWQMAKWYDSPRFGEKIWITENGPLVFMGRIEVSPRIKSPDELKK